VVIVTVFSWGLAGSLHQQVGAEGYQRAEQRVGRGGKEGEEKSCF